MVSGKPPRHSKSKAEPVTIDLDAKDVKDVGKESQATTTPPSPPPATSPATTPAASSDTKPVDGNAAATVSPSIPPKAEMPATNAAGDAKKDENPKPIWDQPAKTPLEPKPNVETSASPVSGTTVSADAKPKSGPSSPQTPPSQTASDALKSSSEKLNASSGATSTTASAARPATTVQASAKSSAGMAATAKSPQNHQNGAGSSGLIAAGIVGGLIALLAAGSMQYAGYLPPFQQDSAPSTDLASVKAQLSDLQQRVSNAPQTAGDTAELDRRIAALEGATSSGGDLSGKLSQLEGTVATLQSERSAQDEKSAELNRRLSDAEAKINEPRDDIEVARAIASAGLKAAIDRGGPFLTELDTLSRVTPDDPAIQSLRPFANSGVPSRAELMRTYPDVANAMLDSLKQSDPNQGIVDRLAESALSLVKVRPVGNVEGEGPDAIIARMEDKLRNGDLKGAALEWEGLPEQAKAASADFKKSLDARIQVEDLVNATLTRAISSTGKEG